MLFNYENLLIFSKFFQFMKFRIFELKFEFCFIFQKSLNIIIFVIVPLFKVILCMKLLFYVKLDNFEFSNFCSNFIITKKTTLNIVFLLIL